MKKTLIDRYDYNLPPELIAKYPNKDRDKCKLLLVDRATKTYSEKIFTDLLDQLDSNSVLVLNNTKVMKSRIPATKVTGGRSEIFVLDILSNTCASALLKGKFKRGDKVVISDKFYATVLEISEDGVNSVRFNGIVSDIMDKFGKVPLPPYINRETVDEDNETYQTVYSKTVGSSAAPTAGLHFSDKLLLDLKSKGVDILEITLDVGLGTFRPVKSFFLEDHTMHTERYDISADTAEKINNYKSLGKKIVAVGTTVVRALESSAGDDGLVKSGESKTDILISEGYEFKIVDSLITNFHLPKSTLLALVSAFAGYENIMDSYSFAIDNGFLFFSYGDAMMII